MAISAVQQGENFGLVAGNSGMHFGNMGCCDKRAWSYPVDRRKNMIACGCRIGPRDTLNALYVQPTVRNTAFLGIAEI